MRGWKRIAPAILLLGAVSTWSQEEEKTLTLKEAVALAVRQNPTVEAARQRLEVSAAAIYRARSGFFPRLSAHERYTRTDYPSQAFISVLSRRELRMDPSVDFNHPDWEDNFNTELRLQLPLYQGGQTRAELRAARSAREAASAELEEVHNALIFQVVEAYFLVLKAQDILAVQAQTVELVETQLELVRARYEAGTVVHTDLLNVEVRLAEEQQQLITARNAVELAYAALYRTLGQRQPETKPALDLSCRLEPVEVPLPGVIEESLDARPALRALDLQGEVLMARVRAAKAEAYPKLNGFGSYYLDSEKLDEFEDGWWFGASVDWTLFNGFRTSAEVRQARARVAELEAFLEDLRHSIELEVRRAYLRADEARQRLPIAAKSVTQADESEQLTRTRYEAGAALITELLDAELALSRARMAEVGARYDYQMALAALHRARGALIQQYGQEMQSDLEGR